MEVSKDKKSKIMKELRLSKVVLNCGAKGEKLERATKLLKLITGSEPKHTKSKVRIPAFGIRPGLEIGCKVTLRGKKAFDMAKKLLEAVDNRLNKKNIGKGFVNFGIREYIEIPGITFQRDIGILGLDVSIVLERPGFSIKRKKSKRKIPARHKIGREETAAFMEKYFNVKIEAKQTKE